MEIIVIIIIIIVLMILLVSLYPTCKYYYLKKYKPNEFIEYAKTWLSQYFTNFNYSFTSLEQNISSLDNKVVQTVQVVGMVLNTLQRQKNNDNSLYDDIEYNSRNCIREINNLKTIYRDIKMIDKEKLCMEINSSLNNILANFRDIGNGLVNVFTDAIKMNKEKDIKEICVKEIDIIKEKYKELINK